MPAPARHPVGPEDLCSIDDISDVQVDPGGSRIAFTRVRIDAELDQYASAIWLADPEGGLPQPFTCGPRRDSQPRWSPDGSRLAFVSDRADDAPQLYVMPAHGGEPRKLTSLAGGVGTPVWSPDGDSILFTSYVPRDPEAQGGRALALESPRVVTRAHFKDDCYGYTHHSVCHLFVIPASGGVPVQLTHGTSAHRCPCWSPDGRFIAHTRSREGAVDYFLTDIWVMDADGGGARRLTTDIGRARSPSWSPDGKLIACYGTRRQEAGLGDSVAHVWIVPVSRGEPTCLTRELDRGVVLQGRLVSTPGAVWSSDSRSVMFSILDAGNVCLVRAQVSGESPRRLVGGERHVVCFSVCEAAGLVAFVSSEIDNPADVHRCDLEGQNERRLTRINEQVLAGWEMPRVERRVFPSPHGGTLDGWVWHPPGSRARRPLFVEVHGGPHSYFGTSFPQGFFFRYVLAARGWAVLNLNTTGSGSYGTAFAEGIRGKWGEYDLPEHLAAVDTLVAEGVADGDRLAIGGYSYGGFMTAWTIGHTDRFRAAVIGAPVTNLESFFGTSDIGRWFGLWELGGDLVALRELYRKLSPVQHVERIATPTLLLHGEADDRCPIGQSEELFVGLMAVGKAPAEMVRYPGGSHAFNVSGRPSHRVDFSRRFADWADRHAGQPRKPSAHGSAGR